MIQRTPARVLSCLVAALFGASSAPAAFVSGEDDLLTIGDPAPSLDIAYWLKGQEIAEFEPGKVYVIEFWATWCAPCVAGMPHLSKLQEQYANRGVSVISVSDEPLQTVVSFLFTTYKADGKIQNDRTRYALTTDPDQSMHENYLKAARQRSIPTAFIIGKDARIEWIGHPLQLDEPLEAVVDDTWDRAEHHARVVAEQAKTRLFREASARLEEALATEKWEQAIEALDQIIAQGRDTYIPTKLAIILSEIKDRSRGYAYAGRLIEQAWGDDSWLLAQVAAVVTTGIGTGGGRRTYTVDPDLRDYELGLKAITRANELTEWRSRSHLSQLARLEFETGRFVQAVRHQRQALQLYEALKDKVQEHEMQRYKEILTEVTRRLEQYEKAAAGAED